MRNNYEIENIYNPLLITSRNYSTESFFKNLFLFPLGRWLMVCWHVSVGHHSSISLPFPVSLPGVPFHLGLLVELLTVGQPTRQTSSPINPRDVRAQSSVDCWLASGLLAVNWLLGISWGLLRDPERETSTSFIFFGDVSPILFS